MTIIPKIARNPAAAYFLGVLIFATVITASIPVLAGSPASPTVSSWLIPVTFCKENNNCLNACGVGGTMTDAAQDIVQKANAFDPSIGWAGVLGCGITPWGDFISRRLNSDSSGNADWGSCGLMMNPSLSG